MFAEGLLWVMLVVGQVLSAGNMNYQQEQGYYEINSRVYSSHPSRSRVYLTKAVELGGVYGVTKLLPLHKRAILTIANSVCWGFIVSDKQKGIEFGFEW